MPIIKIEEEAGKRLLRFGELVVNLSKLRSRVALVGKGTKEVGSAVGIEIERRKQGEGQMRYRDGSYLTQAETEEENFCRDMNIA